jgi:hypothetical protein
LLEHRGILTFSYRVSQREHGVAPQIDRVGDLTILVERPASPKGKPPVLLIHGMFGGAWYWEKYQGYLAVDFSEI